MPSCLPIRVHFFHRTTSNPVGTLNHIPLKTRTVKKDVSEFIRSIGSAAPTPKIPEHYIKDANARKVFAEQLFLEANHGANAEFYARVYHLNQNQNRLQMYTTLRDLINLERDIYSGNSTGGHTLRYQARLADLRTALDQRSFSIDQNFKGVREAIKLVQQSWQGRNGIIPRMFILSSQEQPAQDFRNTLVAQGAHQLVREFDQLAQKAVLCEHWVFDPFTGKPTFTQMRPPKRTNMEMQGIFNAGWSRLERAHTFEEKRQALNGIICGVDPNITGECVGISRATVERLSTRKPVQMSEFSHLNHSLSLDPDYMLSRRKDKGVAHLGESYRRNYNNMTENSIVELIESEQSLEERAVFDKFKPIKKVLHQSFLDEFDINKDGLVNYTSVAEIEDALRKAGDGALGYIFRQENMHVFPVVNIKGDIFALSNFAFTPAQAEALSATNCSVNSNRRLAFAITNQKVRY